ncbi:hypothetical protein Ddc_15386 [Ditylenchus destructor]|nr:hypothetical protein Ddc_15386 [Ditylenchus destructor]
MRRSARLAERETKVENKAQMEPKAKKKRSNDKIQNIAAMDNETIVEAFKFLNYSQLAKNSFVSKRFWNVIRTHRHKLARLYVERISMNKRYYDNSFDPERIKIFNIRLPSINGSEEYNKWVIRNNYSKQIPLEGQDAEKESTQDEHCASYELCAIATDQKSLSTSTVLFARIQLSHESWPLYQHFVRLLADPFIYICDMELCYQNAVLHLMAGAVNLNFRLQCKKLYFNLNGNSHKFITWAKDHVNCNQFYISGETNLNQYEAFLDFFLTGEHCTPSIVVSDYNLSKALVDFLQKFMNLKLSNESQLVKAIEGKFMRQTVKLLNNDYAEFIVKEQRNDDDLCTEQLFEFVNNYIGKKLHLTAKSYDYRYVHLKLKEKFYKLSLPVQRCDEE